MTKGIDDAYRGTVAAGRYPPVALCVDVDPRQVDVNVHPTKQLVRFSDEKEVRLATSEAVRNAIQGARKHTVPAQYELNAESATSAAPSRLDTEGGAGAPAAAPEHHPVEDRSVSETTPPIPSARKSSTTNKGGSSSPDRLFEASNKSYSSDPSKTPDLSEQRKRIEQASAPLSQARSSAEVERGDWPRLRDLRVVGQIASGYILVDEPLAAWVVDQHVAHERALLDRVTDPEDERMPTTQSLLIPEVVELSPEDAAEAVDSLE